MFKVFVVGNDVDREGRAEEPCAHVSKAVDNAEELLVVDLIVDFCWGEFSGVEGAWVEMTVGARLLQDT